MNQRPLLALILMCAISGCRYGQTVETFTPAHTPAGATVVVGVDGGNLESELIEVRDSGLVLLVDGRLQAVPQASIRSIRLIATDRTFETNGMAFDSQRREEIRLLSRYPQGIPPELLDDLLEAYGQTDLVRANQ